MVLCQRYNWLRLGINYILMDQWEEHLSSCSVFISFIQVHLDTSTMYLKFDSTGVQTHDIQIVDSTFHAPEIFVLTTEPSETARTVRGICLHRLHIKNILFS